VIRNDNDNRHASNKGSNAILYNWTPYIRISTYSSTDTLIVHKRC
jgi:hypothetical protein